MTTEKPVWFIVDYLFEVHHYNRCDPGWPGVYIASMSGCIGRDAGESGEVPLMVGRCP
jgi:hypothetical protein